MNADDETLRVYDARADEYAAHFKADATEAPSLRAFVAALSPGARVLDLGCGPGNWAHALHEAGFRVDAVDASAGMVAKASAVEGIKAWQGRFEDVPANQQYDGIWANFSLLHAPRSAMPQHLARLHKTLAPNGVLHIGLKEGTGEARDALGRFYSYHTVEEISAVLTELGMTVSNVRRGEEPGLDGVVAPYFTLLGHA